MLTGERIQLIADKLFGFGTHEYYHYRVGPGDLVHVQISRKTSIDLTLSGEVAEVDDHGYYATVRIRLESGEVKEIRMYRDGPKDEEGAAIQCRIMRKVHVPLQPTPNRI
jgi:hypothetical protein